MDHRTHGNPVTRGFKGFRRVWALVVALALLVSALVVLAQFDQAFDGSPPQPIDQPDSTAVADPPSGATRRDQLVDTPPPSPEQTLLVLDSESKAPVPGAVLAHQSSPRELVSSDTGRIPLATIQSQALFCISEGYVIQKVALEPNLTGAECSIAKARPLRGAVTNVPPSLSRERRLRLSWDYYPQVAEGDLRQMAGRRAWSGAHAIEDQGRFAWQHLFDSPGVLVLHAIDNRSGQSQVISRHAIEKDQAWVEFDLSGVEILERDASITAEIQFDGPRPQGQGSLKFVPSSGESLPFAFGKFNRGPGASKVKVVVSHLPPGEYTPVALFHDYGLVEFDPITIQGRTWTTLRVGVGATVDARILGAEDKGIPRTAVTLMLKDLKGRTVVAGYREEVGGQTIKTIRALPAGQYVAYATCERLKLRSASVLVEAKDGSVCSLQLALSQAYPLRVVLEGVINSDYTVTVLQRGDRRAIIECWQAGRHLAETQRLLPPGGYIVSTTAPGFQPAECTVRDRSCTVVLKSQ